MRKSRLPISCIIGGPVRKPLLVVTLKQQNLNCYSKQSLPTLTQKLWSKLEAFVFTSVTIGTLMSQRGMPHIMFAVVCFQMLIAD